MVCENVLVELRVAVLLSHFDSIIKYPDFVTVKYFYAAVWPLLDQVVLVVEVPVFVVEVPEAEALAGAWLLLVIAAAALLAVLKLLKRRLWHLLIGFVID